LYIEFLQEAYYSRLQHIEKNVSDNDDGSREFWIQKCKKWRHYFFNL